MRDEELKREELKKIEADRQEKEIDTFNSIIVHGEYCNRLFLSDINKPCHRCSRLIGNRPHIYWKDKDL